MIALYVDGRVDLDASLQDIEAAVRSLNGSTRSLVVVELASGKTITVGGGPRRFVTEIAEDATHRWCAVDPGSPEGNVQLVMGGELVETPARLCVGGDAALDAVMTFVTENGARSARLTWSAEG
jgi:hypothetical protein